MKTIVILSGKGGVGKSSITASLSLTFAKNHKIICADCDVDASNLTLVLGETEYDKWDALSTNVKAVIDDSKCNACGKCIKSCYFKAIEWKSVKNSQIASMKPYACEGCGLCEMVCPTNAISMESIENANIGYVKTKYGFSVVSAQLKMGESGSGKVVTEVRNYAKSLSNNEEFFIIDSAAGIGCPVISSVTGTDYAVVIVEPSPSGFSDARKALEVTNHFRTPAGFVINKYDLNPDITQKVEDYAKANNIPILAKIPFDKKFAHALTKLTPIVEYEKTYETLFENLAKKILLELEKN